VQAERVAGLPFEADAQFTVVLKRFGMQRDGLRRPHDTRRFVAARNEEMPGVRLVTDDDIRVLLHIVRIRQT